MPKLVNHKSVRKFAQTCCNPLRVAAAAAAAAAPQQKRPRNATKPPQQPLEFPQSQMSTKVNVFTKPAAASCAAPALSFAKADKATPLSLSQLIERCQPAEQPIKLNGIPIPPPYVSG